MLSKIKRALKRFVPKTEQERMEAFLSQAHSHEHLEQLERQWFAKGDRRW
jgi:hypothetical protein